MLGFIRKGLKNVLKWIVTEEETAPKRSISIGELLQMRHGHGNGNADHNIMPRIRIALLQGLNGKILEFSIHNDQKDEWEYDLFVVPEDKTMSEAIAMLFLLKGGK